jgi:hypothetical protein
MQPKDRMPEAHAFLVPDAKGYQPVDACGDDGRSTCQTMRAVAIAALSLTALAAVLPKHLSLTMNFYGGNKDAASQLEKMAAAAPFSFSVKSGNYDDTPGLGYPFIDTTRFAEPYRTTTFTVTGPVTSCTWATSKNEAGGIYDDFVTVGASSGFRASGSGVTASFDVEFPAPGSYAVTLTCALTDGSSATIDDEVSCMYVRRELRALSLVDREAFLDGFMTLYKTGAAEGVKTYGKHYKPLSEFVVAHLDAAGARDLDHIHDGLGLVTQHTAMTLEFELSLQSVTPRLTVPYW